ncbi:MAG: hypothetical protein A3F67_05820 [Verrucomicrobia bacterium RIFCSPHIGHO2_12_FULL_41_10]|nr:MAG: hypothetical protein A3F67_05820 [Verrucomicrobia bacterium RIFCSPHIGHO2_12_FULL_41_10]
MAHLSKDATAIQEINEDLDFHTDNQGKFKLPSRLIAKKFLFRNIYCPLSIIDRTAYAFSVDNEFKHIGNRKFWTTVIEKFYDKYTGIREYHTKLIQTATTTGKVVSETGRIYLFEPKQYKGTWEWPVSDVANYPVQGFSADLMSLARVSAFRRLKDSDVLFINSVHDSIVIDTRSKQWYNISIEMKKVFRDVPLNFKRIYGKELLVPMDCDVKVGCNWYWLHNINIKEEEIQ